MCIQDRIENFRNMQYSSLSCEKMYVNDQVYNGFFTF